MVNSIFFDLDRTLWDFDFNSEETLLEIYEKYRLTHLGVRSAEEFVSIYKQINSQLWDIEDEIREFESNKDFGGKFTELARSVYFTNDKRSDVKKSINLLTGSQIIEEKIYKNYN